MKIIDDEARINVKVDASQPITVNVEDKHKIDVVIGDAAKMDCTRAINYIKSGTAEIDEAVTDGIADFNANAALKTGEFNTNATGKTNAFNQNATDKTNAFNQNATDKTTAFNDNSTSKTGDFNTNATNKTTDFNGNYSDKLGDFNQNATDKTGDFNTNAVNKTQDFNDNYTAKKQIIDDAVTDAQGYASSASNSADLSKQWAIGDPIEPVGNSSKYWANEALSTVSNMANKDLSNLSVTGEAKFVQPSELATVATTGSYTDLLNKPTIPAAQVNSDWNAVSGVSEILNKPTLATVATSGAYSDLSGTPAIPTVNNATLTITQGGVSKGTFTANASSDVTISLDAGGGDVESVNGYTGVVVLAPSDLGITEYTANEVQTLWDSIS